MNQQIQTPSADRHFIAWLSNVPSPAAFFSGTDFVVEMANDQYLKLIKKDQTIIGKPLLTVLPEIEDQSVLESLRKVYHEAAASEEKEQMLRVRTNGLDTKLYVNVNYQPIMNESNNVTGVLATVHDITNLVLSRQRLQESEERTRLAAEVAGLGTFDKDYKTGETYSSERFASMFGFTHPVSNDDYTSKIHPDDMRTRDAAHTTALRTGKLFYEPRIILGDGTIRRIRVNGTVLFDETGAPMRLIKTALDITDEQAYVEQLAESEARFRTLISETPEVGAGLYFGRELRIQYVNDVMLRFWGKDQSVIGKTWREALPELIGQPFLDQLDNVFTTGIPFTGKGVKALLEVDGELRAGYYNYTYKALRNARGEIYAIHHMAVDVSDEIKTREKLEKSQTLLVQLADQMPQLVWMAESDGSVAYYNKRANEFAGFRLTSNGRYLWKGIVHPDDVDATTEAWNSAVTHVETYEIEHRIQMKDGSYRWHLSRAYPYHTHEGIKWYGTATDVHDSKLMEMNLEGLVKERTLELQRSNDDLQQFAHVASHDLKEPVRKIRTFSYKLQDEFRSILGERGNTFINKILNATDRMNSMINGVLNYASLNSVSGALHPVDINNVISNIESDLELLIQDKQASISFEHLPTVKGAPELIHQLFYNLINNSLKFSRENVPSRIRISSRVVQVNSIPFEEVVVSDNGIGFDRQHAEQIFSTFTRLNSKDKYEGSGLGLSLCKKIVERHGGSISAEGEPGHGATFRIQLPK